ncbi:helix-turn-helix domain-containing protein [Kineosporia succinea]|uniref:Transcriptional regulator with XRE-family HTH domain n=1 Tax=Kineosporia succinea TaxID=84632 RepID=A0ABT9P417_9ACTN|nr:helix-turn-helix transcriptional regulator [Kineosporia succinea]MDP9827159.1 transcriptional regulator with XRE-family HTH domain [Kineosporia succinea]
MAEVANTRLGNRLRALRQHHFGQPVTQRQLSGALRLSGALISSWESGAAIPPEERLGGYARFFCTQRSIESDPARLVAESDLSPDEEYQRERLFEDLRLLRNEVLDEPNADDFDRETGALGGRFLYYPDGQPITILCTPLSARQLGYTDEAAHAAQLLPAVQYTTNQHHPNFVRNLGNADIDALIELVGHVRAENPTADVQWMTYDRVSSADQFTGHLILLGGVDENIEAVPAGSVNVLEVLRDRLDIPIRMTWDEDGIEFDGEVRVLLDGDGVPTSDPSKIADHEGFRPDWVPGHDDSRKRAYLRGVPQLMSDVAIIQRSRNPFNPGATATRFGGMFSRGTYGAVRAFTDARFRQRNELWLENTLDPEDFWMLLKVPVIAGTTMTPDLGRASARIRTS